MRKWFFVEACSTVKKHISSLLYFKIVENTFLATAYKLGDQKLYLLFIISDRETTFQYLSQFCQTLWDMHKRHDCVGYLISFSVFYLLPCLLNKERWKKKKTLQHWYQPNSVKAHKTWVHKRQGQIKRAQGEHNRYPGQRCLGFPLRCPAHQLDKLPFICPSCKWKSGLEWGL